MTFGQSSRSCLGSWLRPSGSFLASLRKREMITRVKEVLILCALCATPSYAEKKLALVIGIAGYPGFEEGERLKYAGRDAEDFAAFIKTPQGGSFSPDNVHLLTNSTATRARLYE